MKPGQVWKHQRNPESSKDEWITPKCVLERLGEFDLDPCAAINQPWPTAEKVYTIEDDGLTKRWSGRVWLNPPYNRRMIGRWMARMFHHDNGIALVFARTETKWFHRWVFGHCAGILFLDDRITFFHVTGEPGTYNAGSPSCLIAYGEQNAVALKQSGLPGFWWPMTKARKVKGQSELGI